MRPSQLMLAVFPFADTFGCLECECAAALMVRALQEHGDTFRAVTLQEICETADRDVREGRAPLALLHRNPSWRPDFADLVARGFAQWQGEYVEPDGHQAIEFTARGLDALAGWSKP